MFIKFIKEINLYTTLAIIRKDSLTTCYNMLHQWAESQIQTRKMYFFVYEVIRLIFQLFPQLILLKYLKLKSRHLNFIKKQEFRFKTVLST